MKKSRRTFTKALGASLVVPALMPSEGLGLWERAEREFEQTGEVSADLTRALLEAQGGAGIYEDPAELEELRMALGRKLRDHRIIRAYPVPEDVEPLLALRR